MLTLAQATLSAKRWVMVFVAVAQTAWPHARNGIAIYSSCGNLEKLPVRLDPRLIHDRKPKKHRWPRCSTKQMPAIQREEERRLSCGGNLANLPAEKLSKSARALPKGAANPVVVLGIAVARAQAQVA